ncbi:DDE-type integrase/transposase/recombinase [Streptomyces melanosporofaciens]|uniref:DDE-type integrase/transposase/recombinase n=1 Tax=Streptomyces sp. CY1 TaxID=3388313 RepID=UPI0039A2C554
MPRQLAEQAAASLFGQAGDAANHQGAEQRRAGADRQARPAPDLIGRDFTADRPGTRLVGDITYLPTAEGWLYLARWLGLATGEVVGYAMTDHHHVDLVVEALRMAHGCDGLQSGCIVHSDRGSGYTSAQSRTELGRLGLRPSTGWTGSCFDLECLVGGEGDHRVDYRIGPTHALQLRRDDLAGGQFTGPAGGPAERVRDPRERGGRLNRAERG